MKVDVWGTRNPHKMVLRLLQPINPGELLGPPEKTSKFWELMVRGFTNVNGSLKQSVL